VPGDDVVLLEPVEVPLQVPFAPAGDLGHLPQARGVLAGDEDRALVHAAREREQDVPAAGRQAGPFGEALDVVPVREA
jgi:hypothetical protein